MIYFDSCIAIYVVEMHPIYAPIIDSLSRAGPESVCTSPLVRLECLTRPVRTGDDALVQKYERYLGAMISLQMNGPVFEEATRIRARFGLKTPDALHLACARVHGCAALWTNDTRLSAAGGDIVRVIGA